VVPGRNNTNFTVVTPDAYQWTPSGTPVNYSWSPSTFLSSTTIANPMANNITATTTYTVTVDNNGCTASGTVTITAGSPLSATGSVSPAASVCTGTTVTLNSTPSGGGAPYTYSWTGPNSFTSTTQNPVITNATVADAGVYTCVITDNCTSTSTVNVTLTVNPLPSVTVSPSTANFCNPGGTPVSLAAGGASTYVWTPSTGLSATTGANVTSSPAVNVVYTVTGTDANGCVSTATASVTSSPAVTNAMATATPTAVCAGSPVSLNASSDPSPVTLVYENFNTGAPSWTRTNASTGGTPANAAWTDRPDGYVYAAGTPYHSNDNTQFVQTNSDAQGSGGTTNATLRSPSFNTTGMTNIVVDFYQYYRDINDNGDSAVVEASPDGVNWTIVTAFTATTGSENSFTHPSVTLPVAFENQPAVYVRFRYIATWDWYWSIDNVTITGHSSNFTYSWTSAPSGFTSSIQAPGDSPVIATTYSVQITNSYGCSATASVPVSINPLPVVTASASPSNVVCQNDMVTFNGGGATSYSWSGGVTDNVPFSASSTGSYTVTGTDANGCSGTATLSLTVNSLPVVTVSANPAAICAGDSSMLTGSAGGTSQWYMNGVAIPGATSSSYYTTMAGEYNMTKTNINGCVDSASAGVMVSVNPLPVVSLGSDITQCGGTATLDAQNAGSAYLWNDNSTNQVLTVSSTGNYYVDVTDANGCSASDSVMVTINALPVVSLGADTMVCGTSLTLDAQNAGSTYLWNDNSTNQVLAVSSNGTYYVDVTDANGCSGSDTIAVTINTPPAVMLSIPTDSTCTNLAAFALSGESPSGGTWSGPGVTGSNFDPSAANLGFNMITYMFTDVNGCSGSASDSIYNDICNGIPDAGVTHADIYPNPNSGQFTIRLSSVPVDPVKVEVMNSLGQRIDAFEMTSTTRQVDLGIYSDGIYFVRITDGSTISTWRVVKQ
ncbi:MAG TPA: T9SS type A sorting domain-containing protein, partial [Bacteroidia bacterium]|nr:T9SS type A sorting domain-containing protein [Bacteroidia bacterium]